LRDVEKKSLILRCFQDMKKGRAEGGQEDVNEGFGASLSYRKSNVRSVALKGLFFFGVYNWERGVILGERIVVERMKDNVWRKAERWRKDGWNM